MSNYSAILKEQFQLAYYGRIDFESTESMTVMERHSMYKILIDQKQEERKAQEEAVRNAEAKRKSGNWHHKR